MLPLILDQCWPKTPGGVDARPLTFNLRNINMNVTESKVLTSERDEDEVGHRDRQTNQKRGEHRGAVVARVHSGGEHHEHQEHRQQHLHHEAPGRRGVGVDGVHAQGPLLKGGVV